MLLLVPLLGPALRHINENFLGIEYVDHYGTQWFYWFVEHQLRTGASPDRTDLFFYPWGKDIFAHTGTNVLDAYLAVPFRMLLGHVAGYNVFVLVMLALSGLAMWKLAREVTGDAFAAGVAGLLFATSPFVMFETAEGRPTQSILLFPVLFILFTFRTARQRGLVAPIAAGIFLALSGYQYWYYAFFGGMVCLAYGLWQTWRPLPDAGSRWAVLARFALIAGVALAITLPGGWKLIAQTSGSAEDVPGLLDVDLWSLTASPPTTREELTIGLQLWQPLRPWAGFYVRDADGTERFLEHAVVMPWMLIPLILVAVLWRRAQSEPVRRSGAGRGGMLAMLAMATILATGPLVIVGDWIFPNPPFILLIKSIGFLQRLWWPGRAVAFIVILLGVIVAIVLAALRDRPRLQVAAAALLTALWASELRRGDMFPFPSWDATIPAGYHCLADGPEGAIIELPYAWTQAHLYFQIIHGRPIMGGMLENNATFTPDEFAALKEDNRFILTLLSLTKMENVELETEEGDLQEVYDLGYRYIVLQKDAFYQKVQGAGLLDNAMRTRMRTMRKQLRSHLGSPVYDDARISIYAPWGDPRPCADDAVEPDTVALGLTEVPVDARLVRTPDEQVIRRVWEPPPEEDSADTGAPAADDSREPAPPSKADTP